jgi:hypothetical protein
LSESVLDSLDGSWSLDVGDVDVTVGGEFGEGEVVAGEVVVWLCLTRWRQPGLCLTGGRFVRGNGVWRESVWFGVGVGEHFRGLSAFWGWWRGVVVVEGLEGVPTALAVSFSEAVGGGSWPEGTDAGDGSVVEEADMDDGAGFSGLVLEVIDGLGDFGDDFGGGGAVWDFPEPFGVRAGPHGLHL